MWRCMAAHGHAESEPSLREARLGAVATSLWLSGVAVASVGLHGLCALWEQLSIVWKFPRLEDTAPRTT